MHISRLNHSTALMAVAVVATLMIGGCKRKNTVTTESLQTAAPSAAVVQSASEQEKKNQCISIERAIDIAQLVQIQGTAVTGLADADKVDATMRSMGYSLSKVDEIYQVGYATVYTQGCQADDMGSMVNIKDAKATLVAIAGKGQPATAALVSISMTDEGVWRQLIHEMGTLGFQGTAQEMSNGHGYKIFYDRFLSGNGFIIQISRE